MKRYISIVTFLLILIAFGASAQEQKPSPFSITGDISVWYEGYGLDKTPENATPDFYSPRRPWNLFRFGFDPTIKAGGWTIPFNFNFTTPQTNFVTPSAGKQTFWQVLTNPANSFGIAPKIGFTEILLGTHFLKYSDLSTGDVGVFGYGVNLAPGKFRVKMFNGVSQSPINYVATTLVPPGPGIIGAYQRNQWMGQL